MAAPTLVVLAAGMGSRYGGLKQLEAVGPAGATLMDYTIFDAVRAGFARAVFVIRPDMEEPFYAWAQGRFGRRLQVVTVHQRLGDLPEGIAEPAERAKPWGTAHAVLAAARAVRGPFVVANADDLYGSAAFEEAMRFLRQQARGSGIWGVVGYPLALTLSPHGAVNRAVCRADAAGWLEHIEEVTHIERRGNGIIGRAGGREVALDADDPVSMNLWAFSPDVFAALQEGLARFLAAADLVHGEYLLPVAVEQAVLRGTARVRVLNTSAHWIGMTYPADRAPVEAELRALTASGAYPARLWA